MPWFVVYLALSCVLLGTYLVVARSMGGAGYPLDDAWIHQTYARNLAQSGRWEYVAGQVSAGSTAPLWTILLALGYVALLPYLVWSWLLGAVCLALCAWLAHRLAQTLWPTMRPVGPVAGLLTVAEWHLVWAAGSGMETLLFAGLALALVRLMLAIEGPVDGRSRRQWLWLGLLGGLLVLTRPEGALLLALFALAMLAQTVAGRQSWPNLVRSGLLALGPFLLLLLPYALFNLRHSGRIWPNTLYAKQMEYGALLGESLLLRLGRLLVVLLAGPLAILAPGVLYAGWRLRTMWLRLLPLVYALAHVLLYAWRLPVTYQHGRYLLPVLPLLLVMGAGGLLDWLRPQHPALARRVLSRGWLATVVILVVVFAGVGAGAFGRDVEVIDSEMVAVADWLVEHSEPGDLVAAHDIGALGYFARRPILDLAGLISPDAVALMNDPEALAEYVLASGARYLVTAPGWPYPALTGRAELRLLYETRSRWTEAAGLNSSAVYVLP